MAEEARQKEAKELEEARQKEAMEVEEAEAQELAKEHEDVETQDVADGGPEDEQRAKEREEIGSDSGESEVDSKAGSSPEEDPEVQSDKRRKRRKVARDGQGGPRVRDPPCWRCKRANEPCKGPVGGSCDRCWSQHKSCNENAAAGKVGRKGATRRAAEVKPSPGPSKGKGKGVTLKVTPLKLEIGPPVAKTTTTMTTRASKRPRYYPVEPPTDLESDEMAAAVMDAAVEFGEMGAKVRSMAKLVDGFGLAMERFGGAMERMSEALNKHDLE